MVHFDVEGWIFKMKELTYSHFAALLKAESNKGSIHVPVKEMKIILNLPKRHEPFQ